MNHLSHLTVIYSIRDNSSFLEEHQRVMDLFQELGDKPWAITAVSTDHEIRRVELIEEAAENDDIDLILELIEHPDVGNLVSLEELGHGDNAQ